MPRVVHLEIPVADADRAKAFYERVFGWGIAGWGADRSYQLCTTGPADEPGIDGALTTNAAPGAASASASACRPWTSTPRGSRRWAARS